MPACFIASTKKSGHGRKIPGDDLLDDTFQETEGLRLFERKRKKPTSKKFIEEPPRTEVVGLPPPDGDLGKADTVARWNRDRFRRYYDAEIRQLIRILIKCPSDRLR